MLPFWYGWNSWAVELLGGAALLGVLLLIAPPNWAIAIACTVSVLYERFLDVNGWSWEDIGQRACGMAVALGIRAVL